MLIVVTTSLCTHIYAIKVIWFEGLGLSPLRWAGACWRTSHTIEDYMRPNVQRRATIDYTTYHESSNALALVAAAKNRHIEFICEDCINVWVLRIILYLKLIRWSPIFNHKQYLLVSEYLFFLWDSCSRASCSSSDILESTSLSSDSSSEQCSNFTDSSESLASPRFLSRQTWPDSSFSISVPNPHLEQRCAPWR